MEPYPQTGGMTIVQGLERKPAEKTTDASFCPEIPLDFEGGIPCAVDCRFLDTDAETNHPPR
jgi:hypothetical protein